MSSTYRLDPTPSEGETHESSPTTFDKFPSRMNDFEGPYRDWFFGPLICGDQGSVSNPYGLTGVPSTSECSRPRPDPSGPHQPPPFSRVPGLLPVRYRLPYETRRCKYVPTTVSRYPSHHCLTLMYKRGLNPDRFLLGELESQRCRV